MSSKKKSAKAPETIQRPSKRCRSSSQKECNENVKGKRAGSAPTKASTATATAITGGFGTRKILKAAVDKTLRCSASTESYDSMAATKHINVALIGVGGVGRALLSALLGARSHHRNVYGLHFDLRVLADSSGYLAGEINDARLKNAVDAKAGGRKLATLAGAVEGDASKAIAALGKGALVVDVSASDATTSLLINALKRGQKVVSANKKPFSSEQASYDALVGNPVRHNNVRHESTVGAGLPAIAALNRLSMSDDKVRKIAGTFSGTLGFVMSGLEAGRPFSEVVLEAKTKGYTEPDPRDDLGGVDVARKALILARGLGWRLELSDVNVEPLYPPAMASLSVDEFLAKLPSLDSDFSRRAAEAKARGEALRYAATVENGSLNVGLVSVSTSSPLGSLAGTDNLVEYYTTWYDPSPLVVRGAGAGAGATAAGVLADMVELSV